ncbi:thiolase family protein [Streptomyces griseorubiginosus]|uniref:thiolase family protein n=1 Tax=Streptomyces griseorubiginosus TaxID=67304 RepID=UPI001AD7CE82|nr:thiolase family protein [Streptomyces griseorubiginosus]
MTTSSHPAPRGPVIAGLGMTDMGKIYGRSPAGFAADAVRRAADDAGLALADLDGLLTSSGVLGGVGLDLQKDLGLKDLRLLSEVQAYGSTAGAMVQYASMAVRSGLAEAVACVFADAPLKEKTSSGAAYARAAGASGWRGLMAAAGIMGANPLYALAARRHMDTYGTTSEQLAHIAVAQRAWAATNPRAQLRDPITVDDHQASRMIAEPFHLLDCCLVTNGGIAVIVTTAERAAHLRRPPVHLLGWAQSHPGYPMHQGSDFGLVSGAAQAGPAALKMAGVSLGDVDVAELYDCYTFTVLLTLEDYGFCAKGEGGSFAASGALAPGGSLPVNTGGGQLSSYYMWGMTPLSEAVLQARGEAGERQVPRHDVVLVSGNGGILDHHSTLVLSPHPHA